MVFWRKKDFVVFPVPFHLRVVLLPPPPPQLVLEWTQPWVQAWAHVQLSEQVRVVRLAQAWVETVQRLVPTFHWHHERKTVVEEQVEQIRY